jgi:hypothetical protein
MLSTGDPNQHPFWDSGEDATHKWISFLCSANGPAHGKGGPWGARSPTSDGVGCSSLRWCPSPSSSPSFSSTPPSHRLIEGLTQSHRPLRRPLLAATLPWRLSFELHRHRGLRLHALCTPPTQAEGLAHCSSTPSRSTWQHGKAPIGGGLER